MTAISELYQEIRRLVEGEVRQDEPLAEHTTFRIGGRADVWVVPEDLKNLRLLVKFSQRNKNPFLIIGAGSNLLVSDEGVRGVVACLSSPEFYSLKVGNGEITTGAGVKLAHFLRSAAAAGLSGAEFLSGIPGTVGGALAVNAGAKDSKGDYQRSISEIVSLIRVVDGDGNVKELKPEDAGFGCRTSKLGRLVIYEARFRLFRKEKSEIFRKIKNLLDSRKRNQELIRPSAGCVFKNPQNHSLPSGQLIEQSRLCGRRLGGAQVSRRHANFIINRGGATARDVCELMRLIQEKVKRDHGVWLEPEIRMVGDFT